jgi:hypothetical protein
MTAYTKEDFERAALGVIAAYPEASKAYKAGDPRFLAQLKANCTMLAMLSAQIELAEVEPFLKTRDGTVLADCALKGVLHLAMPAKAKLLVENSHSTPLSIASGRFLLDSSGRKWAIDTPVSIAPHSSAYINVSQIKKRQVTHAVTNARPFYRFELPQNNETDSYLVGFDVNDQVGGLVFKSSYANVESGERVFSVETDEYRRFFLRFGFSDGDNLPAVGHSVKNGDVFTINIQECDGQVILEAGAVFVFEYLLDSAEDALSFKLDTLLSSGAFPPTIEQLRFLSKYPAAYDGNAVYLGNFDFLVRKGLGGLDVQFLSVWNEQIEEAARGANVMNINRLFVSYLVNNQSAQDTESLIKSLIYRADDSYDVSFVPLRRMPISVQVTAEVSAIHDPAVVASQIKTTLLSSYGEGSIHASKGTSKLFRFSDLYADLKRSIPAFQDNFSDLNILVNDGGTMPLPEDYRYISSTSLHIDVLISKHSNGLWSN